jgi:hypothetical protein
VATRTQAMHAALDTEIARMRAMQLINPQVSQTEIDYLLDQRQELTECYKRASLQLTALRLLIVSP